MKYYPDQHGRKIPWPDGWPEPLFGANAGPLANPTKYEAMVNDIKTRGLREKIKLTPDGKIAEGRNRYRVLRNGLKWSHERIVAEACVTVDATDLDAALSNIMRVNRTNFGLIASYLMAHPKWLADLLKDRKNGSKSGKQTKLATIIGCSPKTVVRVLDEVTKAELRHVAHNDILEILAADSWHSADHPVADQVTKVKIAGGETTISHHDGAVASEETEQKEVEDMATSQTFHSLQPTKEQPAPAIVKDRRLRVTPEIREKVIGAFKSGSSSKREIARVFNISHTTVREIVADPDAKRKPAAEDDPVGAKLLSIWRKFGQKELKQADVPSLLREAYALANVATLSVSLESWSALCKQGTK